MLSHQPVVLPLCKNPDLTSGYSVLPPQANWWPWSSDALLNSVEYIQWSLTHNGKRFLSCICSSSYCCYCSVVFEVEMARSRLMRHQAFNSKHLGIHHQIWAVYSLFYYFLYALVSSQPLCSTMDHPYWLDPAPWFYRVAPLGSQDFRPTTWLRPPALGCPCRSTRRQQRPESHRHLTKGSRWQQLLRGLDSQSSWHQGSSPLMGDLGKRPTIPTCIRCWRTQPEHLRVNQLPISQLFRRECIHWS